MLLMRGESLRNRFRKILLLLQKPFNTIYCYRNTLRNVYTEIVAITALLLVLVTETVLEFTLAK